MPCAHRFAAQLIPAQKDLQFLFIGTFNPAWDAASGNNAEYFYGRASNLFWCIMPHAFHEPCLIDRAPTAWKSFCQQHHIGITDLISCVPDADQHNAKHVHALTREFSDDELDRNIGGQYVFNPLFITSDIIQLITQHQRTLRGIFFTRSTQQKIPRIWENWLQIKDHCAQIGRAAHALPSPSPKGGTIRGKIDAWRSHIYNLR